MLESCMTETKTSPTCLTKSRTSTNPIKQAMQESTIDKQLEQRRLQKTIKELESACGKGTSLISLYIPPGQSQIVRATKMLNTEYGISANIKSRV